MKYHLNIIDGNVEIPKEIDIEYDDIDTAYEALRNFVHQYDYEDDVCGRVVDEDGEDIEYCNSIDGYRYDVLMDGDCAESFDNLDDAISHAEWLYGKGYTDDVVIYDNKTDEEVEW